MGLGTAEEIAQLVHGFAKHIKHYKSKNTKEAEIRQQFIDPFWRLLGWDVGDTKQVGPTEAEVIIEKNVDTAEAGGLRNRRPDYMFRLGGFSRFVVEAKKPAIDLDDDREGIFQAKQYAWNSTIPFAVLTDFEQFRLYDTTLKPILYDPQRGLVAEFKLSFENYEPQWDVLAQTFGRDAVEGGSLERLLATVKKLKAGKRIRTVDRTLFDLKGSEPVDRAFLSYLDVHRRHFAAAIYKDNKAAFPDADTLHGAAKLTEAVQRIMDRLVFMRVIEDRGVVAWGALRETLDRAGAEGGEFYGALCATFRDYNARYNGYLFRPHFSEELHLDGSVLADFTRTLYPGGESAWDFAAIGDDILGTVYERFLGNTITVKSGRVEVEVKPEYRELAKKNRHKTGVFYTPRFVVDSIVRRVIGPKLLGRTPAEVLDVKVLDPACGSGSFLVAAMQFVVDYCLAAISKNPALAKTHVPAISGGTGKGRKKKSEIAFQDMDGRWYLAPDFRAALLTHCIHGVDIDQQAVEVTVMSLYLKMLESKLPENWATLWVERQLLPPLDNNVQCGNSLIDEESYFAFRENSGRNQRELFAPEDVDTTFRINRFDWTSRTRGFGRLLDSAAVTERGRMGFDCIIGNPPYIRVQELNKWAPEECEFYKWKYKAAAKGNYDIYVVFTERTLSLLAPEGLLGFIMPHKFLNKDYAAPLRALIASKKCMRSLIHFGANQIFHGATTYTGILELQATPNTTGVVIDRIGKINDAPTLMIDVLATRSTLAGTYTTSVHPHPTNGEPWAFSDCAIVAALAGLPTLGEVARIFVGIQTDADDVYYVTPTGRKLSNASVEVKCHLNEKLYPIEESILRPLAEGELIKAHLPRVPHRAVVFPFEADANGRWRPMSVGELASRFPFALAFFNDEDVSKRLKSRAAGRLEDSETFWDFVYKKNLARQHLAKVCVPRLAERVTAALDAGGTGPRLCLDNVDVCGVVPNNDLLSLELLVGFLNSRLLDYFMKASVRDSFRGGYLSLNKQYLRLLPIKLPTTPAEKAFADRITGSVRAIMEAKAALRGPGLSDRQTQQHRSAVEAHENRIDEAVFALYGVDGLPAAP